MNITHLNCTAVKIKFPGTWWGPTEELRPEKSTTRSLPKPHPASSSCLKYFIILQNVFVQIDKYICQKLPNIFVQFYLPAASCLKYIIIFVPYLITRTKFYMLSIVI